MNSLKFKGLSSIFLIAMLLIVAMLMVMSMITTAEAATTSNVDVKWDANSSKIGVEKTIVADPQGEVSKKYKKVKTYTLTFNPNGGKVKTKTKKLAYTKSFGTLPKPTRSGYIFQGWYTKKSSGKKVSKTTKMLAKNVMVYAHWKKQRTINANERALVGEWSGSPKLSLNEVNRWIKFKSDGSFKYYYMYTRVIGYFHEKNEITITGNYRVSSNKVYISNQLFNHVINKEQNTEKKVAENKKLTDCYWLYRFKMEPFDIGEYPETKYVNVNWLEINMYPNDSGSLNKYEEFAKPFEK